MASPETADAYLQQVHSARTQLQAYFRRAHEILTDREADLLRQLDDIQTSYEQETKSRKEEIQDLEKSKLFLKTCLHDNDTLNKALVPLTDKLEQILRLASAARTVRFQWNNTIDGDLQLVGEIITISSALSAVIPHSNLISAIPEKSLFQPQTPVMPQTSISQPKFTPDITKNSQTSMSNSMYIPDYRNKSRPVISCCNQGSLVSSTGQLNWPTMSEYKSSKDRLVYYAKLAEQAERFDDMKEKMKARSEMPEKLSTAERNLLSVAYKNIIGARRSAWRVISSIESKYKSVDCKKEVSAEYKAKIEKELDDTSNEVIGIIDKCLEKEELASEEKVFYNKMKGDYYRYRAEYKTGGDKSTVGEQARDAYEKSLESADSDLKSTHPIRLGLALNFSVFYYEILKEQDKACEMAKKAFDNAIQELDLLEEDCYKDSTMIMQLLKDNLTLWTSDTNQDDDIKGDGQDDDN